MNLGSRQTKPMDGAANNPLPPTNDMWKLAARSIPITGRVLSPGAGVTICTLQAGQFWQQTDVYRLDVLAFYDTQDGAANDMAIFVGPERWYILPVNPSHLVSPVPITLYCAAGDKDFTIQSLTGKDGAGYNASIILTRLQNGFRVG